MELVDGIEAVGYVSAVAMQKKHGAAGVRIGHKPSVDFDGVVAVGVLGLEFDIFKFEAHHLGVIFHIGAGVIGEFVLKAARQQADGDVNDGQDTKYFQRQDQSGHIFFQSTLLFSGTMAQEPEALINAIIENMDD